MDAAILDLWREALMTMVMVAGPFVLMAFALGLITSIIQAATQLQEAVLSFAPKLIGCGLLLAFAGHWLLDQLVRYFHVVAETAVRVGQTGGQ
jgi:flagellar biosynthetic protein FliQ